MTAANYRETLREWNGTTPSGKTFVVLDHNPNERREKPFDADYCIIDRGEHDDLTFVTWRLAEHPFSALHKHETYVRLAVEMWTKLNPEALAIYKERAALYASVAHVEGLFADLHAYEYTIKEMRCKT